MWADRVAKRLKKSRSELYADALAEYLARREPSNITAKMNEALEELGDDASDGGFAARASRSVLKDSEW